MKCRNKNSSKLFKMNGGIIVFIFTLGVHFILNHSPELCEKMYSRGVYVFLRNIYDLIYKFVPLSGLLFAIIFFIIIPFLIHIRRKGFRQMGWWIINRIAYIASAFYLMWGFNYNRIPFLGQVSLEVIPLDTNLLNQEFISTASHLNELRIQLDSVLPEFSMEYKEEVQKRTRDVVSNFGYPSNYTVSVKEWKLLQGFLLRLKTAGIYIPHALEGNIDGGLHLIQKPFVCSHEMAHGFGITHEGIANFIAFKACNSSEQIMLKYSGHMSYFKYLSHEMRFRNPAIYKRGYDSLHDIVKNDMLNIKKQMDLYPDIFPAVRDIIYDSYLKSHGITDGVDSYNFFVQLVISEKIRSTNLHQESDLF